jgi:hypothetical protein
MGDRCGEKRSTGGLYAIYGDNLALETTIFQGLILRNRAKKKAVLGPFWPFLGLFFVVVNSPLYTELFTPHGTDVGEKISAGRMPLMGDGRFAPGRYRR